MEIARPRAKSCPGRMAMSGESHSGMPLGMAMAVLARSNVA